MWIIKETQEIFNNINNTNIHSLPKAIQLEIIKIICNLLQINIDTKTKINYENNSNCIKFIEKNEILLKKVFNGIRLNNKIKENKK